MEHIAPRRPELLLKSEILLKLNQAGPMASPLQTWVTDHAQDGSAWQMLARVWRSTQTLRMLRQRPGHVLAHEWGGVFAPGLQRGEYGGC